MKTKYRIRAAQPKDRQKIQQLYVASVANKKNIFNPSLVNPLFIDDFVNKVIEQGNMIVVENLNNELELIGEVHYYNTSVSDSEEYMKEIIFSSRVSVENDFSETELIDWLYGEIEKKHQDVFSVVISTPVKNPDSVKKFRRKGIKVNGNYHGRLNMMGNQSQTLLPLSWINPSFN